MRLLTRSMIAIVLLTLAGPAAAQLSPEYASWADGPAGFLLTKDEAKAWKAIDTDAEAERFIALFWARRDPVPATPVNEFRQEFEGRVRSADERFATDDLRGALTDRGRVLILLGPPHSAEKRGPTETVVRMGEGGSGGAGTDEVRANAELWQYDPQRMPEAFKAKGSQLLFIFYERKAETNTFTLDRSHQHAPMGLKVLARAPEALLVNPELDEVPAPVCAVGATAASPAQLAWLDAEAPLSGDVAVLSSAGLGPGVNRPFWVQLQLPDGAPRLDTLAGRVLTPEGAVAGTFALAAEPLELTGATAYQLAFPLEPGTWRIELAGAVNGEPQVVRQLEAVLEPVPATGTWVSPLWTSVTVRQEPTPAPGAAYRFGPLHLVPDARGTLSRGQELPYFGFLVRPQATPGSQPTLEAKVRISRDGKRLGSPVTLPVGAVQLQDDVWVYAGAINLAALPELGSYTLSFTVKDPASGAEAEDEVSFELVDEAAGR